MKRRTVRDGLGKLEKSLRELDGAKVSVGVKGEHAWLAGIHEYGCQIEVTPKMRAYLHGQGLHLKASTKQIVIPERSFLRAGFDAHHEDVLRQADPMLSSNPDAYLKAVGLLLKSAIQDAARDLRSSPNHPFTKERKGSSNPLADTGDMIGGIRYEVEK